MTKSPDKNSKRSTKRRKRGFQSLAQSSRKHRRAASRMLVVPNEQGFKPKGKIDFSC